MNKGAIIFFLGALTGAAAGVLFTKKHYEKVAEDAMQEYADHYFAKEEEVNKVLKQLNGEEVEDAKKEKVKKKKEKQLNYDDYEMQAYDPYKTNYNKVKKDVKPKQKAIRSPFIISSDEYDNAIPDYDKVSLVYFAGSQIFMEQDSGDIYENGDVQLDMENNIIGNNEFSSTGDIIFIRNEDAEIDFSIIFDDRDYETFQADADILNNKEDNIEIS